MTPHVVPAELRERHQWVAWKNEQRDGKPTKVPYRADGDGRASSTDSTTWASFNEAINAADWLRFDGVGYVFAADDPYCGIDLDASMSPSDRAAVISTLNSYTETSVSGTGAHVIVRASLASGRHPAGFGVFDRARYFVMTGDHVHGTPETIEPRQAQLDEVLARYLPTPDPPRRPPRPVELDDRELLERAFRARNGPDFERLYQGDTTGFASRSEADLAFCCTAAFWTGRDPARIDAWLRSSGLMRDKWERTDYRERTIEAAIAATQDVYTPRPAMEKQGDHEPLGEAVPIVFEPLRDFLKRDLPPAESLIGETRNGTNLLPRYGWVMPWGREGSGKTSMLVDLLFHAAAGTNWQHYPVARPLRIVAVINEGIPGGLQDKLAQKLELWEGNRDAVLDNLAIYASPWGQFTFRNERIVAHAHDYIHDFGADYAALDPLHTLGTSGAGSPQETEEFKRRLHSFGLWDNLGIITSHHSNKNGMVSGDWARHPDTVLRLEKDGKNPATKVTLEKARPADPAELGVPMLLEWIPETMGYRRVELESRELVSDEELLDRVKQHLAEQPAAVWLTTLKHDVTGDERRIATVVKAALDRGEIINESTHKGRFHLHLPRQTSVPTSDNIQQAENGAQTHMDTRVLSEVGQTYDEQNKDLPAR